MASFISAARDRIAALCVTSFAPAGNNRLIDVATAEKIDWRQLMERVEQDASANGLAPPYTVLAYGPAVEADASLKSTSYEMQVHVLYVVSLANGATTKTASEVRTEIEDKLLGLQSSVYTDSSGSIQCWDSEIDCDSGNGPNSYYLTTGTPLYAGVLRLNLLIGKLL